jgi:hypothetical protein
LGVGFQITVVKHNCENFKSIQTNSLSDPLNKLVLVPSGEVINLGDESKPCPKLDLAGSFGTFIDGKVIMCHDNSSCFSKSNSRDAWVYVDDMTEIIYYPRAVHLSEKEWWVIGGYSNKTEVYTVGIGFSPFVDLPEKLDQHNVMQINSTHFMYDGLQCNFDFECTSAAWMFDKTNRLWTRLPNPGLDNSEERISPCSGLVKPIFF